MAEIQYVGMYSSNQDTVSPNMSTTGLWVHQPRRTKKEVQNKIYWMLNSMGSALILGSFLVADPLVAVCASLSQCGSLLRSMTECRKYQIEEMPLAENEARGRITSPKNLGMVMSVQ